MCSDYIKYIAVLSDVFDFNDLVLLNKLYGQMDKFSKELTRYTYPIDDVSWKSTATKIGNELFGDINRNVPTYNNSLGMDMYTEDLLLQSMKANYMRLFNKLKELAV